MKNLILSIIVTGIAGWIIIIQTDTKNRLLATLVFLWAVFTIYQNFSSYRENLPKPNLILDKIDQEFDGDPPTKVSFFFKIRNSGNSIARNVNTKMVYLIDNEEIYNESEKQVDINPEQVVRLRSFLYKRTFQEVWKGKRKLRFKLEVNYSDENNKNFNLIEEGEFNPSLNENVFSPSWLRKKTQ